MNKEMKNKKRMERYYARRTDVAYVCQCCGVIYHPKDVRRDKYCSRECSDKQRVINKEQKIVRAKEFKVIRFCERCGLVFDSERKRAHCSDECARDSRNKKKRESTYTLTKCKCCGKEYMQEYKGSNTYCSEECIKTQTRSDKRNRRRLHIRTNGRVDEGINIKRLIRKDKNICHICNLVCDDSDYVVTSEGYFITGDDYPSVDHVVPLSKGGTHTHDNVRLAHFKCNRDKSDNI